MKNIWIINHYAGDMFFAEGGRHYSIGKFLKQKGYNPIIICANSIHNSRGENHFHSSERFVSVVEPKTKVKYYFVKARGYSNNGIQRILNMFDFFFNVKKIAKQIVKDNGAPDIILASSVHPLSLIAGLNLSKKYGTKCICEIRDLWPESIVVYSNRFKRDSFLMKALYHGEHHIYMSADLIIFTAENEYQYIIDQGWQNEISRDKVVYLNNGIDLAVFDQNKTKYQIQDEHLDNDSLFNIVYTGSIRKVNNLGLVLDIAKEITNPKVRFLIWGDGDELPALKKRAELENVSNVIFKGKVDKKYIPYITSRADINYAHNTPSPLFKYGLSFNKIFDYLAAGKPIICDFPANCNPAIDSGAGICIDIKDIKSVANEIDKISFMDNTSLEGYGKAARKAAMQYDYNELTNKLIESINNINNM